MSRPPLNSSPPASIPTTVLLAYSGTAGETKEYTFTDGSIRYFDTSLRNSFAYVMIDNFGTGLIRISYNQPARTITDYVDGAKTLKAGDSFYIEESIWYIKIYFIGSSTVELVLKSDKAE